MLFCYGSLSRVRYPLSWDSLFLAFETKNNTGFPLPLPVTASHPTLPAEYILAFLKVESQAFFSSSPILSLSSHPYSVSVMNDTLDISIFLSTQPKAALPKNSFCHLISLTQNLPVLSVFYFIFSPLPKKYKLDDSRNPCWSCSVYYFQHLAYRNWINIC